MQKKKRIVNRELLDFIKTLPCLACGSHPPTDPDHLQTVKSGGNDTANNVWSLCRLCHIKRHKIGLLTFIQEHSHLKEWLELAERFDILDKCNRQKPRSRKA